MTHRFSRRTRRTILASAAAGCLLAAAVAAAQEEEALPGAEAVPQITRFNFAWPAGLTASVVATQTRERKPDAAGAATVTIRFTLQAEASGDRLRIHYGDPRVEMPGHGQPDSGPRNSAASELLGQLVPDYLVTSAGEFAGLHDLEGFQSRLRQAVKESMPADVDVAALEPAIAMLTSGPVLEASAAEQWNSMVGAWLGAELEHGMEYRYSQQMPLEVLPGQEMLMDFRVFVDGVVPCRRGGMERQCIAVVMESSPNAEDARRVIDSMLGKLGQQAGVAAQMLRDLHVENDLRLVTEPETLVPHAVRTSRWMRVTVEDKGQEQQVEQLQLSESTFTYE